MACTAGIARADRNDAENRSKVGQENADRQSDKRGASHAAVLSQVGDPTEDDTYIGPLYCQEHVGTMQVPPCTACEGHA